LSETVCDVNVYEQTDRCTSEPKKHKMKQCVLNVQRYKIKVVYYQNRTWFNEVIAEMIFVLTLYGFSDFDV